MGGGGEVDAGGTEEVRVWESLVMVTSAAGLGSWMPFQERLEPRREKFGWEMVEFQRAMSELVGGRLPSQLEEIEGVVIVSALVMMAAWERPGWAASGGDSEEANREIGVPKARAGDAGGARDHEVPPSRSHGVRPTWVMRRARFLGFPRIS